METCYRHPSRETGVRCSSCERPICTDCMVYAAVGIKCPECAGRVTGAKGAARRVQRGAAPGAGGLVTKSLIGVNLAVILLPLFQQAVVNEGAQRIKHVFAVHAANRLGGLERAAAQKYCNSPQDCALALL